MTAHELSHLRLECEARQVGKNQFFATSAKSREVAIRSMEGDIRRWKREGYGEETIGKVAMSLAQGLCGFLFNCPVDMFIEMALKKSMPKLAASQFLSVRQLAREAWEANNDPQIRKLNPRFIMRACLALNGAHALFLDQLFEGTTEYSSNYRPLDSFDLSEKLYRHFQDKVPSLRPGDEYRLVDDFADMLKLRDWYEWKPDPGQHAVTELPPKEGPTNPDLLKAKHTPAVFFLLDALKRFKAMTAEQVREIAFEVASLGRQGLDYSSAEKKYRLKTLPDEDFSGLHLMCLMYAGFKQIAPEQDTGMDLNEPFLQALSLFNAEKES